MRLRKFKDGETPITFIENNGCMYNINTGVIIMPGEKYKLRNYQEILLEKLTTDKPTVEIKPPVLDTVYIPDSHISVMEEGAVDVGFSL